MEVGLHMATRFLLFTASLCVATASAEDFAASAEDFVWGTATAAYQVEGSRHADGRQPSLWDAFDTPSVRSIAIKATKPNGKSNIYRSENAVTCDDDYLRYPDSVELTSQFGFKAARLSIAWPRIMTYKPGTAPPGGHPAWERNSEGIAHYKKLLSAYAARGIGVALTMFHWDLPLVLEDHAAATANSSAWLQPWIAPAFAEYASLLVAEFGDAQYGVKWWITINEPLTIVGNGYAGSGPHAPGRCSDRSACWAGDDRIEPYVAAKNLLLAHARAFRAWRQGGSPGLGCGITLNGDWREPFDPTSAADRAAAIRSLEWQAPLFADPIHFGDWTPSIAEAVGARLDKATGGRWAWSAEERSLVHGSHDGYFFMNTYTSGFARAGSDEGCGWSCDAAADASGYNFSSHAPIGTPSSNGWLFNHGAGIGRLVEWYHGRYPNASFVVTENGWGNASSTAAQDIADHERCNFYRDYLGNLSVAAARGADVRAYFAWSLMDNYEWADGFSTRFGLTYVDYETQRRTPKLSARWFAQHVTPLKRLPTDGKPFPPCESVAATLGLEDSWGTDTAP